MGKLSELLQRLTDREIWTKAAGQSRNVALNELNPDKIHAQFEAELAI